MQGPMLESLHFMLGTQPPLFIVSICLLTSTMNFLRVWSKLQTYISTHTSVVCLFFYIEIKKNTRC